MRILLFGKHERFFAHLCQCNVFLGSHWGSSLKVSDKADFPKVVIFIERTNLVHNRYETVTLTFAFHAFKHLLVLQVGILENATKNFVFGASEDAWAKCTFVFLIVALNKGRFVFGVGGGHGFLSLYGNFIRRFLRRLHWLAYYLTVICAFLSCLLLVNQIVLVLHSMLFLIFLANSQALMKDINFTTINEI